MYSNELIKLDNQDILDLIDNGVITSEMVNLAFKEQINLATSKSQIVKKRKLKCKYKDLVFLNHQKIEEYLNQ